VFVFSSSEATRVRVVHSFDIIFMTEIGVGLSTLIFVLLRNTWSRNPWIRLDRMTAKDWIF